MALLPFTFGASEAGYHEMADVYLCPQRDLYRRVRGIVRSHAILPEPLSIGLLLHVARAQWLHDKRRGSNWRKAMDQYVVDHYKATNVPLAPAAHTVAVLTFNAYIEHWSVRPFPEVLAVEYEIKPKALVPGAPQWAWRGARLDSIEKFNGKIWLGELKSTSDSADAVEDYYLLHPQILMQAALWGQEEVERFGPLGGVLLDIMVKPRGDRKAKAGGRKPLPLSEMEHAVHAFKRDMQDWIMLKSGMRWSDHVPRTWNCVGKFGPCPYRDLCLLGRRGAGKYTFQDGTPLTNWKPSPGKEVPPWD